MLLYETAKKGRFIVDQEKGYVIYLPNREASLEQLMESVRDFPAVDGTAEEMALKAYQLEKLREALGSLSDMDRELIWGLFCEGKTAYEVCADFSMAKSMLHRRKAVVLEKMNKIRKIFIKGGPKQYLITETYERYFVLLKNLEK